MPASQSAGVAATNAAISAHQKSFEWETALQLLSEMPCARTDADAISFGAAAGRSIARQYSVYATLISYKLVKIWAAVSTRGPFEYSTYLLGIMIRSPDGSICSTAIMPRKIST